ncbi:uncharacterized protein LOC121391953 [Gigantopelta aegis]|uniref:uncharacterized protein LOC121391953 n=1 Tax=Gigantopelta aegis TaxID=1735272 RepID=UPI001B88DB09|nr:uncharacterized protein LOC121391953 [Gigantopelta aegis]
MQEGVQSPVTDFLVNGCPPMDKACTQKSGIFSKVLDEIHDQECVLKQTVSSKTKFVFLSFPSKWQGGASKEKSTIENCMKGLFNSLRDMYSESDPLQPMVVQIDLQDLNGFPLKKALKPIISILNSELLLFEHPVCLVLSVVEETDAEDLTAAFKDVMERNVIAGKFENYTSSDHKRPLSRVAIKLGKIAKQQCEVLVNTTTAELDLTNGAVSKSVLDAAGNGIIRECTKTYPEGINIGQIAKTSGGKIKSCSDIYHGALQSDEKNRYKARVNIVS